MTLNRIRIGWNVFYCWGNRASLYSCCFSYGLSSSFTWFSFTRLSLTWWALHQVECQCASGLSLGSLSEWFIDLWSWDLRCWCLHSGRPIDNVGIQALYKLFLFFSSIFGSALDIYPPSLESHSNTQRKLNRIHQYPWSHVRLMNCMLLHGIMRFSSVNLSLRWSLRTLPLKSSKKHYQIRIEWIY